MTELESRPPRNGVAYFAVGALAVLALLLVWHARSTAEPLADRCLAAARQQGLVGARWNDQAQVLTGYLVQPGLRVPVTASCRLTSTGADLQMTR